MIKTMTWLVALMGVLLLSGLAFSAPSAGKGVALIVDGDHPDAVRREISDAIPPGLSAQDGGEASAALAQQGIRSPGDAIASPKTRKQAIAAMRRAVKQTGLAGILVAHTKRVGKGGAREIRVVLVTRTQAEPVEVNLNLARGEKATNRLAPFLTGPLQESAAAPPAAASPAAAEPPASAAAKPAPPASKPEPSKAEDPAKENKDEASASASAEIGTSDDTGAKRGGARYANAFVVGDLGVELTNRVLTYNQVLIGTPRGHTAPAIAGLALGVQVYPLASSNMPFAKDIGIVGRYARALEFDSKTKDGSQSAKGHWSRYALGLRGRIHGGAGPDSPLIGVEGTYGAWMFDFSGSSPAVSELPNLDYKYLRGAVDARFPFGALAVTAGVAYLNVLSSGDFGNRFPHASIGGVDASVGLAYGIRPWLEARVIGTYTRFFSSMHSKPGDAWVAGGALDQYLAGNLGVTVSF